MEITADNEARLNTSRLSEYLRVAIGTGNLQLCNRLAEEGVDLDRGFVSCAGCTPVLYALQH